MSWNAVAIAGSTIIQGALGAKASGNAADAQRQGSRQAIAEQQRQYNTGLQLLEPQRNIGYQALGDLAHIYGWSTPGYQSAQELLGGGMHPITVGGGGHGGGGNSLLHGLDPVNFTRNLLDPGGWFGGGGGGGGKKQRGGTIDPTTGTVDVKGDHAPQEEWLTHYLQTGEWTGGKGGKLHDIRNAIDQLRSSGWTFDPHRTIPEQGGGTGTGGGGYPGSIPGTPAGPPGQFDRFFTSPDYNYRVEQGSKALERSAAARTGALNPNTQVALQDLGQQMGSQEYGNYVNRLFAAAGLGQAATSQAVQVGQNTASNIGNAYQNSADARASGILGTANSITGALNSGLNAWMLNRGGYFNKGP